MRIRVRLRSAQQKRCLLEPAANRGYSTLLFDHPVGTRKKRWRYSETSAHMSGFEGQADMYVLAIVRLITKSHLVGCYTGNSAAFGEHIGGPFQYGCTTWARTRLGRKHYRWTDDTALGNHRVDRRHRRQATSDGLHSFCCAWRRDCYNRTSLSLFPLG